MMPFCHANLDLFPMELSGADDRQPNIQKNSLVSRSYILSSTENKQQTVGSCQPQAYNNLELFSGGALLLCVRLRTTQSTHIVHWQDGGEAQASLFYSSVLATSTRRPKLLGETKACCNCSNKWVLPCIISRQMGGKVVIKYNVQLQFNKNYMKWTSLRYRLESRSEYIEQ